MRTLSVREVAGALGLTKRAVMYRLENGKLKGTRVTNTHGQEEWRVYPNKEIMQAVETRKGEPGAEAALNFEPEDGESVEAESVTVDGVEQEESSTEWRNRELDRLEIIAEKLMKPLADKLEAQAMALREKDMIIEEQGRQLKLLPDFEKRAREAEEDRKAAELRALETDALKKQITALQEQIEEAAAPEVEQQLQQEKEAKESELEALRVALERERQVKQDEIKTLEEKLASVEEYKKLADEAQAKLAELQKTVDERNLAQESDKEEKDSQTAAIREELAALSKKLDKSQTPWWKKMWSWGTESPGS